MPHLIKGLAVSLALAAYPVSAEVETVTNAPDSIFASGAKVAVLWTSFNGTRPNHIIIQNPGPTLEHVGGTEGTLTTACDVVIGTGIHRRVVRRDYNNNFTTATSGVFIWFNASGPKNEEGVKAGSNRPCDRIISMFARFTPAIAVDQAVADLQDFRPPFRMSVRGESNWGDLLD